MPVTRKQKNKGRRSAKADMISDVEIVVVMMEVVIVKERIVSLEIQIGGLKASLLMLQLTTIPTHTQTQESMKSEDLPETAIPGAS